MACILMIPGSTDKPRNGFERHIYEISRRLGEKGFNVINVVPSPNESFCAHNVSDSYTIVKIPVTNMGLIAGFLDKIDVQLGKIPHFLNYHEAVRKFMQGLDRSLIVHAHGFYALVQPKNQNKGYRRLITIHGFGQLDLLARKEAYLKVVLLNSLLRRVYRNAECYTTFSDRMKRTAIQLYGMDPSKIAIVPHGVDVKFFSSKARPEEIERTVDRFKLNRSVKVLFVCHIISGKGLDILINTFKLLRSRRSDVMLILKTSKEVRHYYETLRSIEKAGIKDVVSIISDRVSESELRALYQVSDVFVNYFLISGISTALLEAMASGMPPIIHRSSSCNEIVDQSCGVLSETFQPDDLASAIELLADDKKLRKQLGYKAAERVLKEYDWDKVVVPQYVSIYKTLD